MMSMKNVLFVYAHMDDETIMSFGTMMKLKSIGCNIFVACLCGKGRSNEQNQSSRRQAFVNTVQKVGAKYLLFDNYDLSLTGKVVKECIARVFHEFDPDTVFTHSCADIHDDHRLVAKEMLIKCRKTPDSHVKAFFSSVLPSYAWSYDQLNQAFQANTFFDITEFMTCKNEALNSYSSELKYECNDFRSIQAINDFDRVIGHKMSADFGEEFQQIFSMI